MASQAVVLGVALILAAAATTAAIPPMMPPMMSPGGSPMMAPAKNMWKKSSASIGGAARKIISPKAAPANSDGEAAAPSGSGHRAAAPKSSESFLKKASEYVYWSHIYLHAWTNSQRVCGIRKNVLPWVSELYLLITPWPSTLMMSTRSRHLNNFMLDCILLVCTGCYL